MHLVTRVFSNFFFISLIIFAIIGIPVGVIIFINTNEFDSLAFAFFPPGGMIFLVLMEYIGYKFGNHERQIETFLNDIYGKYKIDRQ